MSSVIDVICDTFAEFRSFPSVHEQMLMALEHAQYCAQQGADVLNMYGVRLNWSALAGAVQRIFRGAIAAVCRFPNDIQELMSVRV